MGWIKNLEDSWKPKRTFGSASAAEQTLAPTSSCPCLEEGENSVTGDTMMERAKKLNANMGEEDGQFVLEHQDEIHSDFRGKSFLIFMGWRHPNMLFNVAYLGWDGDEWFQYWQSLYEGNWDMRCRLVRRVS